MPAPPREKTLLIESLIREASDVDLICYLARTATATAVQDLLECIADAHALSEEDLFYNLQVVLQKKREAAAYPMADVLRRMTDAPAERLSSRANGTTAVH